MNINDLIWVLFMIDLEHGLVFGVYFGTGV